MVKGIFGDITNNKLIGWAFDITTQDPLSISVFNEGKLLVEGKANIYREDLLQYTGHIDGRCGFAIELPKGRKNWSTFEVFANDTKLSISKRLESKIKRTKRTLRLKNIDSYFFIHLPKTAGTSVKNLLFNKFQPEEILPSQLLVKQNNGLYPHFEQLIKLKKPGGDVRLLLGHYPFAANTLFDTSPKTIIILRDPIERAISNIFHMKYNDSRLKNLTPFEIYKLGHWNYCNLQTRYLADEVIHLNMHFISPKRMSQGCLRKAKKNLEKCSVVGISESLGKSVDLMNCLFGWNLQHPKRINKAKGSKQISEKLSNLIREENALDIELYHFAKELFEEQCKKHAIS